MKAETETKEKKQEKKPWSAPTLDSSWPSPIFGGSTGGLMRKAQVRLWYRTSLLSAISGGIVAANCRFDHGSGFASFSWRDN